MKVINVNGKKIEIKKIKVKHLPRTLKIVSVVVKASEEGKNIIEVLSEIFEDLIALFDEVGIAEKEWLLEQDPADLIDIVNGFVNENIDFFLKMSLKTERNTLKV